MTKTIDTLISDIQALLTSEYTGDQDTIDSVCEAFGARMSMMLYDQIMRFGKQEPFRLRMSAIGKPETQLWFDSQPDAEREQLEASAVFKFMYGHVIEELALSLAVLAGHTVTRRQEQVELEGVYGHIDALIDDELVDVKSTSSYGFEKFEKGTLAEDDSFGYVYQISGYAQAMEKTRAFFFALDKTLGHMCLMPVRELYDAKARIQRIKEVLSSDVPPIPKCTIKRDKAGNEYLGSPCSYCPHKEKCNPGLRTFIYSTGPRFYTKLVSEPRVTEVTKT